MTTRLPVRAVVAWTSALVVAVGSATAAPATTATAASEPGPTRVMLLGDSITHGSAGDWTWRYRLWQHLQAVDADVDLVGPATDLWQDSTAYADPAFDRDHASRWGETLGLPSRSHAALVAEHRPDVVVVLLGLNDLTFLQQSPEQVAELMRDEVAALRQGEPGLDVVLSRLPSTDIAGVPETNERYSALAAELDTPDERVVVAAADAGFVPSTPDRVADTYDQVHPSARGELRIAAAVADALAAVGVGTAFARPLPTLPLGPRQGASLTARAGDERAVLRWTSSPGTTSEQLWRRDVTAGSPWVSLGSRPASSSTTVTGLRNRHRYAFRLRPAKVWAQATDTSSAVVTATPAAPAPAAPRGVTAAPRPRGALVQWSAVRRATSYVVGFRVARPGTRWQQRRASTTARRLWDLRGRTSYVVRVRAVDDGTAGPWSGTVRVRTRAG